jgi:protein transport protein YIF1
MYDRYGNSPGMQMPPPNPQPGQFGNAFNGPSSGLIRTGLEAYGGKFLDSSSEFMQSNVRGLWFGEPLILKVHYLCFL